MSRVGPVGPDPGRRRLARPDRNDPYRVFLDLVAARCLTEGGRAGQRVADEIDRLTAARSRVTPSRRAPAVAFLDTVLAQGRPGTADLLGAVAALAPQLAWHRPDARRVSWQVAGRVAWAEIVGPTAPAPSDRFRLGLHLQGPRTRYPLHAHAADELYLTLAGEAWWARGEIWEEAPEKPGTFRRHGAHEAHGMETRPRPMLALYAWWGEGAAKGKEEYRLL